MICVKVFNDLSLAAATRQEYDPERTTPGPPRETLADTGNIYFTYRDFRPGNLQVRLGPGKSKLPTTSRQVGIPSTRSIARCSME